MRVLPVLIAAAAFAAPALAEKPQPEVKITYEADTYRFAEVYRSERGTTVEACAMMCNRDRACASWSLTPATFRIGPRCELKSAPGSANYRPGSASGMSEAWQMDAGRHANMRYQTRIPASRQPEAVPVDQVRPSPIPRVFGDPPPVREPELMGGPNTQASAILRRPEAVAEAQPEIIMVPPQAPVAPQPVKVVQTPKRLAPPAAPQPAPVRIALPPKPAPGQPVEVLRGPAQGVAPEYVKQPAPQQPAPPKAHPLYGTPPRVESTPRARTVFRDPARDKAALPTTDDYNAVLRRESQAPAAQPVKATTPTAPSRAPWTERESAAPDYSVGGTNFIPGDEDATAGFIEGAPEAGS